MAKGLCTMTSEYRKVWIAEGDRSSLAKRLKQHMILEEWNVQIYLT